MATDRSDAGRSWAWTSRGTSEGDPLDRISVLAVIETIGAVAVYVWIALNYGTLHLTISACIAPFLLLRTPLSTKRGLTLALLWERFESERTIGNTPRSIAGSLVLCVTVCAIASIFYLVPIFIRIVATAHTLLLNPFRSIAAIPENWWRFVSRLDSCTTVEAIPGVSRLRSNKLDFYLPRKWTPVLHRTYSGDAADWMVGLLATFLYAILIILPVFLYHWAVKGTSLVYSPFIYVVYNSLHTDATDLLSDIRDLALHRAMRWYAAFVLLVSFGKLYLFMAWSQVSVYWNALPAVSMINAYVLPEELAPWHVAAVINAALTLIVYFAVDYGVARATRKQSAPSEALVMFVRVAWLIRGVLSIYTIACVLYISASLVPQIDWPPLGPRWFPWSA